MIAAFVTAAEIADESWLEVDSPACWAPSEPTSTRKLKTGLSSRGRGRPNAGRQQKSLNVVPTSACSRCMSRALRAREYFEPLASRVPEAATDALPQV